MYTVGQTGGKKSPFSKENLYMDKQPQTTNNRIQAGFNLARQKKVKN